MIRYLVTVFIVIWLATGLGIGLGATVYLGHLDQGYAPAGLSVAGLDIGGWPLAQVEGELARLADQWQQRRIAITYPKGNQMVEWELTAGQMGVHWERHQMLDQVLAVVRTGSFTQRVGRMINLRSQGFDINPVLVWPQERKEAWLDELQLRVNSPEVLPRYDYSNRRLIPGQPAQSLERESTAEQVLSALQGERNRAEAVVSQTRQPWAEGLGDQDFAVEIAGVTTPLADSDGGRVRNIELAAQWLDGRILPPGGSLSFNEAVGPRTRERGFQPAPEIVRQKLVTGIGGGVCQVSTTLYNAALLSGMKIVERRNHSSPLGYVPLGRDATVYGDIIDLRIANDFEWPVALVAGIQGQSLWVKVMGRAKVYDRVTLESASVEVIPRPTEYISLDGKTRWDELPPDMGLAEIVDEGQDGYRVAVYRNSERGGQRVRELISRDYYPPTPRIVAVAPLVGESP